MDMDDDMQGDDAGAEATAESANASAAADGPIVPGPGTKIRRDQAGTEEIRESNATPDTFVPALS